MSNSKKGNNILDGPFPMGCRMTPWSERSYLLLSLWEIMQAFNAALFNALSKSLGAIAAAAGDPIPEAQRVALREVLVPLLDDCIALGLPTSAWSIRKMLDDLTKDPWPHEVVRALAGELQGRLVDEMRGRQFLSLNLAETVHYELHSKGWEGVFFRFPNAMTDVEEARKCLALGRYTAAVFHLMRVTEAAVLELQCFLNTKPDPKAHFGSVLQKLDHLQQRTQFKDLPDHLKPYAGFLSDVLPQLHAVKDSWRNKVSHVDDRIMIADVFTEEMALGIYGATLLLMKKLARGLPPNTAADEPGGTED
jgi:hypothetical protein